MKAREMFDEMGWKLKLENEVYLVWFLDFSEHRNAISDDVYIVFKKETPLPFDRGIVSFELNRELPLFVKDNTYKTMGPIMRINEKAKVVYLGIEHHKAIHQQIKELGWL